MPPAETELTPTDDKYLVNLPAFEGPLDLLLFLIEKDELDITSIAISQITDQYLLFIQRMADPQPDRLAEFLVIAAKLILIKSQTLLPKPPPSALPAEAEEDLAEELARQLRAYKFFKEMASELQNREESGLRSYARIAPPQNLQPHLDFGDLSLDDLLSAIQKLSEKIPDQPSESALITPFEVTINDQIEKIKSSLEHEAPLAFTTLLINPQNRVEVIVTILAVLELIKQKDVEIYQEALFGEIFIKKKSESEAPS
jgi:segregation and condensation protein A